MTQQDRKRWDKKWSAMGGQLERPHDLLRSHMHLLTGGDALDLACGRGQNSLFLAEAGYSVLAVDISDVALTSAREEAKRRGLKTKVRFELVDLDEWFPTARSFDLIAVFRFLKRSLFPAMKNGLRPGGLVFYSTRNKGMLSRDSDARPEYLLEKGELLNIFSDWEIIHAEDGSVSSSLVARKSAANS